jgi:hypothetical protein
MRILVSNENNKLHEYCSLCLNNIWQNNGKMKHISCPPSTGFSSLQSSTLKNAWKNDTERSDLKNTTTLKWNYPPPLFETFKHILLFYKFASLLSTMSSDPTEWKIPGMNYCQLKTFILTLSDFFLYNQRIPEACIILQQCTRRSYYLPVYFHIEGAILFKKYDK